MLSNILVLKITFTGASLVIHNELYLSERCACHLIYLVFICLPMLKEEKKEVGDNEKLAVCFVFSLMKEHELSSGKISTFPANLVHCLINA